MSGRKTRPNSIGIISIRKLKTRAAAQYAPGTAIRELLLAEPDEMPREEVLTKLTGWIVLIRNAEAEPAKNGSKDRNDGRQT
jgi:hypothetical protein